MRNLLIILTLVLSSFAHAGNDSGGLIFSQTSIQALTNANVIAFDKDLDNLIGKVETAQKNPIRSLRSMTSSKASELKIVGDNKTGLFVYDSKTYFFVEAQ